MKVSPTTGGLCIPVSPTSQSQAAPLPVHPPRPRPRCGASASPAAPSHPAAGVTKGERKQTSASPQSKQGAVALSHRGRAPEITHTFLKSHHPTLRLQITHPTPAPRGRGSDSPGLWGEAPSRDHRRGRRGVLSGPLPPCFDPHIHDQRSWPLWVPDRQGVIRNTAMETLPSSRHLPLKDGAP